ncbi:MAG TPA: universal stress protein [Burkholderiaceae bacterium]|nr:universal stress protein [Burkholderiaceae bacterium]
MFKHILVPSDGSSLSAAAADRAIAFAAEIKARITFVHALPPRPLPFFGGEGGMFVDQTEPDEFEASALAAATKHLAGLEAKARAAGLEAKGIARGHGAPYEVIIELANEAGCDLILMASHGRTGIKSLILGSETQKVLTHTRVPVLVYR